MSGNPLGLQTYRGLRISPNAIGGQNDFDNFKLLADRVAALQAGGGEFDPTDLENAIAALEAEQTVQDGRLDGIDGDQTTQDDRLDALEGAQIGPDNIRWDDMLMSGLAFEKGTVAPDLIAFGADAEAKVYGFAPDRTEFMYSIIQFAHRMKAGSEVRPHVHWTPTDAGAGGVVWALRYAWASIGEAFSFTTITADPDAAGGTAWEHQVAALPAIETGKAESSIMVLVLLRDHDVEGDDYNADAAFLHFDIHYQVEKMGTVNEYPAA